MTQNKIDSVIEAIEDLGFIPLFYHSEINICLEVIRSIFNGGCNLIEFTNRGDKAKDNFGKIMEEFRYKNSDNIIGVGTVYNLSDAREFISMGADFLVGPCFVAAIAELCNEENILYMPGCATPTEIMHANSYDVELIKIFPANTLGGPDFIKSVKAPFPWLKLIPSGGVKFEEESLKNWFKSGVSAVGMGSDLIGKQILDNKNFNLLERMTHELIEMIKKARCY